MSREPIRLAYFSNAKVRAGVEEHILTLLRGLDRKQFCPMLICSPEVSRELASDVPSDVSIISIEYSKLRHVAGAIQLMRCLRRNRIQILHSHLFYSSLFASPVGWLAGVPVIVETPHLRERWRHGPVKGSYAVDRMVSRFVNAYIAVSNANAVYLAQVKRIPQSKIHIIQNGTDVNRFQQSRRGVSADKRAMLGFEAENPVVVVPARLEPQKGHSVLLNALPQVLAEFPNAKFVLAGEGALLPQLQSQVQRLGLASSVRFVGRQPDIESWFDLCEFTVLPSLYEGLPLVSIESLACAKPMVATAVDGTPEVIIDGRTGLTVPAGNSKELAHAVIRMLRDPQMRNAMGLAGREWVLARFTEERQIRDTQALYVELVARVARKEVAPVQKSAIASQSSSSV